MVQSGNCGIEGETLNFWSNPDYYPANIVWFVFDEVLGSMLQIAEAVSLEEGTRHLAIEFMLLDIEDEAAWHTVENDDEDAWDSSNYSAAQECFDRLAIALGGNTIVPVASEQLQTYLAAPELQKKHAALIALAQITE
ncbi:importin-5 [Artemisia annua]|uniref:Importin-5 n=1 Tax=Artemisia annua TaxID=35608 RepID=A0A2U1M3F9_ARTAN|nr:importin-5 [Artemisia annua]